MKSAPNAHYGVVGTSPETHTTDAPAAPLSYLDAIDRAYVTVPGEGLGRLVWVRRDSKKAQVILLSNGRHWRGPVELLRRHDA